MIRKTYGVTGLMDWTAQIKAGKGAVSVHFTGGALTAYGVTPATYSTTKPFFQHIIEHSDYFKSGRIKLVGAMNVPDDAATIAAGLSLPLNDLVYLYGATMTQGRMYTMDFIHLIHNLL